MDRFGWQQLQQQPWLDYRKPIPLGPVFGVICGPTRRRAVPYDVEVLVPSGTARVIADVTPSAEEG
jgi:hypothetical protein